jgi:transposase-like protein
MFKFSRTVSLPSIVLLGITLALATRAVAADAPQTQSNSAPVEVKSTDSMAQSQQLPTERYGCFSGYRERTYQGERPLSRYEFAAGLNSCLNQVNQLINSNTSDRVTQEELAVPKRQLETLKSELERLRMRVDSLDSEN